jgi:hypothetical protein
MSRFALAAVAAPLITLGVTPSAPAGFIQFTGLDRGTVIPPPGQLLPPAEEVRRDGGRRLRMLIDPINREG